MFLFYYNSLLKEKMIFIILNTVRPFNCVEPPAIAHNINKCNIGEQYHIFFYYDSLFIKRQKYIHNFEYPFNCVPPAIVHNINRPMDVDLL